MGTDAGYYAERESKSISASNPSPQGLEKSVKYCNSLWVCRATRKEGLVDTAGLMHI